MSVTISKVNSLPTNVASLSPGSRCILPNGKEYILNNSKQWIPLHMLALEMKADLTTENLNSVTSYGIYLQNQNVNATVERNYPSPGSAGILKVFTNGNDVYQEFQVLSGQVNENKTYTRGLYGGVWSSWLVPNFVNFTQAEWNTVKTNSHTHSNKANLDSINQDLNRSSSVIFDKLFVNNSLIFGANAFKFYNSAYNSADPLTIGNAFSSNLPQVVFTGGLVASDNYAYDGQYLPLNGIYSKGVIKTENNLSSEEWKQAYNWGNHATAGYLKLTQADAKYVKLNSFGDFQSLDTAGLTLIDTVNENTTYYASGMTRAIVAPNQLTLSNLGLYSELKTGVNDLIWFGHKELSVIGDDISFKFITYNLSLDKYTIGVDKPIYFEPLNLGTTGATKTLTLDSAGKLGYINGTPLMSFTETDPTVPSHVKAITQTNLNSWNSVAQNYLGYVDDRIISPNDLGTKKIQFGFTSFTNNNTGPWADFIHFGGYQDAGGGNQNLIVFNKTNFGIRQYQGTFQSGTSYNNYVDYWHSGNFDPVTKSDTNHTHTFASLTSKPTTLAGYGITDSVNRSEYKNFGEIQFGTGADWTTTDFINYLTSIGFFNQSHSIARGSWGYAGNSNIVDAFGGIELAGTIVESFSNATHKTIRITCPTTSSTPSAGRVFVYNDQQNGTYSPGWREEITTNSPSVSNWNTAYGWDNHATQGYLKSSDLSNYVTTNTLQTITGHKEFQAAGNTYHQTSLQVKGNGSTVLPGIGFHQPGIIANQLNMSNDGWFQFVDGSNTGYANLRVKNIDSNGMISFNNNVGGVYGVMGDNDAYRIWGRAAGSNQGYLEISTADDGNEPIIVSQYTGQFINKIRQAVLLDEAGNTSFPGTVTAPTFSGTSATFSNDINAPRIRLRDDSIEHIGAGDSLNISYVSGNGNRNNTVIYDGQSNIITTFNGTTHEAVFYGDIKSIGRAFININGNQGSSPSISLAIGDNDTGFNWEGDGSISYYSNNTKKFDLNNVWHLGNDGAGSGLDADLLDGKQGNQFINLEWNSLTQGNNVDYNEIVYPDNKNIWYIQPYHAGNYTGQLNTPPVGGYGTILTISGTDTVFRHQLAIGYDGELAIRSSYNSNKFTSPWVRYWSTNNFTDSNINNWNAAHSWGSHVDAWNAATLSYSGSTLTLTINGIQKTATINAGTSYSLPTASATVLGGVKLFSDTVQSVASNAVTTTASRTYGVQLNSSGQMVVNVPWVDTNTNTTYSAGNGLTLTGTVFSLPITVSGSGNYITDVTQTTNGITVTKGTLPTYTAGTNISISSNQISVVDSPTFSGTVTANSIKKSNGTATQILMANGDVIEKSDFHKVINGGVSSQNLLLPNGNQTLSIASTSTNFDGDLSNITFEGTFANFNGSSNSDKSLGFTLAAPTSIYQGIYYKTWYGSNSTTWRRVWDTSNFSQSNINNWNAAHGWGSHVDAWNAATLSYSGSTLTLTINGIPKTVTINAGSGVSFTGSGSDSGSLALRKSDGTLAYHTGIYNTGSSLYAAAFYETSLKKYKTNIEQFDKSGIELLNELDIVTFDKIDGPKNKIGIIADNSPKEFLSEKEDAVDLYNTIFIQAKAIQELSDTNDMLQARIGRLEEEIQNLRDLLILKLNK